MNHKCFAFLILCIVFFPLRAYAWSAQGHKTIAVAAFEHLPKATQYKYEEILRFGPWLKSGSQANNYSAIQLVAMASKWPDRIRSIRLEELFVSFGSGTVPKPLQSFKNETTGTWHFVNSLFLNIDGKIIHAQASTGNVDSKPTNSCSPKSYGRLFQVWPLLFDAYKQSKDVRDQSIILAFIFHFAGDAYQPLHVFGSLDNECNHDRGGNLFCLQTSFGFQDSGRRCKHNLHQLWDAGFHFFELKNIKQLSLFSDLVSFKGEPKDLKQVQQSLSPFFAHIYPKNKKDLSLLAFQEHSKSIVEAVSKLAVSHLYAGLVILEKE